MSTRSSRAAAIVLFLLGACTGAATSDPDAGQEPLPTCSRDDECPVGQVCRGGACADFEAPVETRCSTDADCAAGELCAPSTGLCVPAGADAGEAPDAGGLADCADGETRQCGETKVGACDWGVLTCTGGHWPPDDAAHCVGAVFPAAETCNGEDDDCNNFVDDGAALDADEDGFTSCGTQNDACCAYLARIGSACSTPGWGVDDRCSDCNDHDAAVHPGASERCNGADDDCDGLVAPGETDADGDGVRVCDNDCDDRDPLRKPGAPERCNGLDDDCDGVVPPAEKDGDGDGFAVCARDCDDADPLRKPGASERCNGLDDDCDGVVPANEADQDGDGVRVCAGDCNDHDAAVKPGAAEPCGGTADLNCDGRVSACNCRDADGDGYADVNDTQPGCAGTDCDDANAQVHPGATEACDGRDNDCDSQVDEGADGDGDGFNRCGTETSACCTYLAGLGSPCGTPGRGTDPRCVDCADGDAAIHPGAAERCNGLDDDCTGGVPANEADADGDGVRVCAGDCDDTRSAVKPGASEACNGLDDDCNGKVDDDSASDRDSDGFTACGTATTACCSFLAASGASCATPGRGTDARCVDCNDTDTAIRPGATERCNGLDDDCDGNVPTSEREADGDGYRVCAGDCDDSRKAVNPAASEACNGLDDDCNGSVDDVSGGCNPPCGDADADGFTSCGTKTAACCAFLGGGCSVSNLTDPRCADCADSDGSIHPGAAEVCNGKDDSCDGRIDEGFDVDADGFTRCGSRTSTCCAVFGCTAGTGLEPRCADCNDADAQVNPGITCDCAKGCTLSSRGSPDGVDENCNGYVDESCSCSTADVDRDGYSGCQGDCNDNDRTVHPGATEICDCKDNDCNQATTENCGVSEPCNCAAGTDACRPNLICARNVQTGVYSCGSFCNFSQLGLGLEDGCQSNESCAGTLLNTDNLHLCAVAANGTGLVGASCSKDDQCKSGSCLNLGSTKYCTDLCGSDAYCGNGTTCQVLSGGTAPTTLTGQCLRTTSTRKTGASCAQDTDCASRYCDTSRGKCADVCCKASDCPAGYACTLGGPRVNQGQYGVAYVPVCLTATTGNKGRRAGAACSQNSDCLSLFCERSMVGSAGAGICVEFCCNDASCPNDTTCEFLRIKRPDGSQPEARVCVHLPVKGEPLVEQTP